MIKESEFWLLDLQQKAELVKKDSLHERIVRYCLILESKGYMPTRENIKQLFFQIYGFNNERLFK